MAQRFIVFVFETTVEGVFEVGVAVKRYDEHIWIVVKDGRGPIATVIVHVQYCHFVNGWLLY